MVTKRPVGLLKSNPDCFIVQELVGPNETPVPLHQRSSVFGQGNGHHTLFHLVKRGVTTFDALKEVARQLNVSANVIGCHGLKDRHAYTSQCVTVFGAFRPRFDHPQIVLCQQGTMAQRAIAGKHAGNRFRIRIMSDAREINTTDFAVARNRFGAQRFGAPNGNQIGRLLLEGDADTAASLVTNRDLIQRLRRLREQSGGSWADAFFHPEVATDCGMFVLQWQSHLWNILLDQYPLAVLPERLPMWTPDVRRSYQHLWDPSFLEPEAVARLHRFDRPTLSRPKKLKVERGSDYWDLQFDLPPGAYATVVLEQVFELREPVRGHP